MKKLNNLIVHCASCIVHQSKPLTLLLTLLLSVNLWGDSVTFTGADYKGKGGSSGTGGEASATKNGITIISSKAYYSSDTEIREYTGTIKFSGAKITKIELTSTASGTANNGPSKIGKNSGESGSYSYSGKIGTWENNEGDEEVVLKCSAQFRWSQIVVTYVKTEPYMVNFYKADGSLLSEKKETSAGAGVTTPSAQSTTCSDWTFAGWTTDNITEVTSEIPAKLTKANTTFHPVENCSMYPVFTQKTSELVPLTEIIDLTKLSTSPYASNDFTIKWGGSFAVGAAAGSCGFKSNSNMTITMPTDAKLTKVSIHNSNTWGTATVVVYAGTSASGTNCGSMSSVSSGIDQYVSIPTAQQLAGSYYLANTKSGNAWVDKVTLSYMGYGDVYLKNPICAPTYAVNTNNPSNGVIKFSTDGTNWSNSIADQQEDADVFFKLVPNAGYEVSGTPTVSNVDASDIIENDGIYLFTMPASPVTVSATFSCATPTFKTNLSTTPVEVTQGLTAPTLTVAANETYTINYQWQSRTDQADWSNIGTNSASYATSSATVGTTYFRCLLKNGVSPCETFATSNVATVTVNAPSKCETPTFSLAAGTYTGAQSVTLSCLTPEAKIYYTTDGTEPSTSSTEYAGAINVFKTMTIRAIAAKDNVQNSDENSILYTIQYTVTFNMQGHGEQVQDQKVDYEGLVTDPQTQSITGWTFGGWFKEGACTNKWDFATDKVTTNPTILYAKWDMTMFDVKFYNNGNELTEKKLSIQEGQTIGTLPTLTTTDAKDAFSKTFVGWTEEEVTTWQPQAPTPVTSTKVVEKELILNAVWAKETEGTGYTNNYQRITSTADLTPGDYAFVGEDDFYGYNLFYYALDKTTYNSFYLTATEVTSKLSNDLEKLSNITDNDIVWTIAFKNNDNSKISIKNGSSYLNIISSSGHHNLKCSSTSDYFTYSVNNGLWKFVSENQSGYKVYYDAEHTNYTATSKDASVEGQLYLYKRIRDIAYTDYITHSSSSPLASITLNTDNVKKNYFVGETFTSANLSATAKLEDGIEFPIEYNDLTISTPADLSTAGEKTVTVKYTFNGATKSNTFTVNAYSVTINLVNTDRVDDEPVTGNTYSWTPTTGALTFSTQAHYQFNGITSEVVGVTLNGTKPNYTLSNPTANVTMTATWQRLFTLTYNGKGGSTTPAAVTDQTNGTKITLATPSRTGYDFVGWYDNESYEGDALTSPYTITADAEIFAKWSEIMPASISLSPDVTEITDLIYDDSNKNTKKITATVNPSAALTKTFTWSVVEGADVVSVSSEGLITALKAGTAKVKVASTRDANVYKEIAVTVHALPQITWKNMDGTTYASTKGTSAGKVGTMPSGTPSSCDAETYPYFRGWSATNFGKTTDNPEADFVTINTAVELDKEYTFYAVCAAGIDNSEEYSFTIQTSDFNTTSYAANNGSHDFTATATIDASKTMTIACTTNQIFQNSGMQWQANKGYVYNTTDLGTIKSVVVSSSAGTFTTYYGTTEHPTSGTTVGNGYFTVQVGNATGKTSSIVVTFETGSISYTTWATQCCTTPDNPLEITNTDLTVKTGKTLQLNTTEGNGNTKEWNSLNSAVATVTSEGVVTPVSTGKATITVSQEAFEGKCEQYAEVEIEVIAANEFGIAFAAVDGGTTVAKVNGAPTNKATKGTTVTITATPADDYNFTSWTVNAGDVTLSAASSATTTFVMGDADVEITPSFALKQFTITLDAGNGTVDGESTKVLENQDIHSKITLPDAVACNSDEWEFKGWATSSVEETTDEPTFVSADEYEVTDNATLYAVYGQTTTVDGDYKYKIYAQVGEAKKYMKGIPVASATVINQIESGSEDEAQTYTLVTIGASADKYALKYLDNETVKYLCINTSGSGTSTNYNIQGTETLENNAYWTMSNGAKGGKIFTNVEYKDYGLIYRNADASRTYDVFKAYKTPSSKVTVAGTEYYDLNLQQVGREQKEGGVWNSNPSCAHHYQVTYDGNGTTTTCASEKLEEGEITLCADEPSLAGYTFAGWNDGTSTYAAGASYNLTAPVTFTAVWNPIKVTAITLNVTEPQTLNWKSDAATPTFQLSVVSTTPAVVADNSVTWSVSDGSAVSVSETGLVTALEAGTATITATANDGSNVKASCTFTVTKTYKLTITNTDGVYNIKANGSTKKDQYIEAETEITLSGTTRSGYIFGEWVVKQGETPITVTDDKFTMPAAEVTVTATFTTKKDYYVDDMNDNAQIVMEGKYTVPSLPDVVTPSLTNSCEQTHLYFVGWIEGEIDEGQPEVPSGLITAGEEKTAGEKTYHAVWAEDSNNNQ